MEKQRVVAKPPPSSVSKRSRRRLCHHRLVHALQAVLEIQTDVEKEGCSEARGQPTLARPTSKPVLREEERPHLERGLWAVLPALVIRLDLALCHQRMSRKLWSLPKDFIQGRRKSEPTKQVSKERKNQVGFSLPGYVNKYIFFLKALGTAKF